MLCSEPKDITLVMMRETLFAAVVCDALDSLGYKNQSPRLQFAIQSVEGVLVGRCKTTLWSNMFHQDPKPYDLELKAVDRCQPDDVLVVAAGGSVRSGVWGELLSTAAGNTGCVGALVDGAIRDLAQIKKMGFPVYARGTSIYDSQDRQRVVDLDVPVELDGVTFSPGDLIFADCDGVVVVPQEIEADAVRRAWEKVHAENRTRDAIMEGMLARAAYDKFGVL